MANTTTQCLTSISDHLIVWNLNFSAKDHSLHQQSIYSAPYIPQCSSISFSPSNQIIAASYSASNKIQLLRTSDASIVSSIDLPSTCDTHVGINSIDFSSSSRFLSMASKTSVYIWDFKRNVLKYNLVGHESNIVSAIFSSDNVISGDEKGDISIWSLGKHQQRTVIDSNYNHNLTSLGVSNDFNIASGYNDGSLRIWDNVTTKLLRTQQVTHHHRKISQLTFSPRNSRLLMTAGTDHRVSLFDIASRNLNEPSAFVDTGSIVNSVSFHESAIYFAAGLDNGMVYVYDWRNTKTPVTSTQYSLAPIRHIKFQRSSEHSLRESIETRVESSPTSVMDAPEAGTPVRRSNHITKAAFTDRKFPQDGLSKSHEVDKMSEFQGVEKTKMIELSSADIGDECESMGTTAIISSSRVRQVPLQPATRLTTDNIVSNVNSSTTRVLDRKQDVPDSGFEGLRHAMRPVNNQDLSDALSVLRYDIHREVQVILNEQMRLFDIAKTDNMDLIASLSEQLRDLLAVNQELRAENERLRRIY